MRNVGRKLAFVLAASNNGTMILNRFDYRMTGPDQGGIGVGLQLLETGSFDPVEIELALQLLQARQRFHGDGVVALDCGANIGAHTIEWAIAMTGWGSVIAIEAQERIYYALAGNIAINNCFNAIAMHAAVSSEPGIMNMPVPDYFTPSSFGSLELKPRVNTEFIGQPIDYSKTVAVQQISIDSMALPRVDFIKLDIEGMEMEALAGAKQTIARCHPIVLAETIKAGRDNILAFFEGHGYKIVDAGINMLAIHKGDPVVNELQVPDAAQSTAA
ncbi:MAG TPA: FkbM family methyltransferase [Pseudolabrys sp.]|jgi:FkbM family methyltransferase|nr:FkbM family methyltransferase [Pseudolabrys sp.]